MGNGTKMGKFSYKVCSKCRNTYRLTDVFSKSICPMCNTHNEEIASWHMYTLDLDIKGRAFSFTCTFIKKMGKKSHKTEKFLKEAKF